MGKAPTIPRPYLEKLEEINKALDDTIPSVLYGTSQGDKSSSGYAIQQILSSPSQLIPYTTIKLQIPGSEHRYLSLTKLAADTGISVSHLSRIMHRRRAPSFQVAVNLAWAMGVTLDDLAYQLGVHPTPHPGS